MFEVASRRSKRPLLLCLVMMTGSCNRDADRVSLAYASTGARLHWRAKSIVLTPAPEYSGAKPPPELRAALAHAAAVWNRALADCHAPRLLANQEVADRPIVTDDLLNVVILHEIRWCPVTSVQREDCYPADLQARTHLYPLVRPGSVSDGELRGIDIEVNGVDFQWSEQGRGNLLSLQTILTHELGHVLGLDHPCGPNTEWSSKKRPLVACDPNATTQIMRADIASITKGEITGPSTAEVAAVCALYP